MFVITIIINIYREISVGQQFTLRKALLIKHQIHSRRSTVEAGLGYTPSNPMEVGSLHVYDIYTKYYFHWCLNFCSFVKIEPLDFDLNSVLAFDLNLSSCTPKVFDNRYLLMCHNLSGAPDA